MAIIGRFWVATEDRNEERDVLAIDFGQELQLDKINAPLTKFAFGYEGARFSHQIVDLRLLQPCISASADQLLTEGSVSLLIRLVPGVHVRQI